MSRALTFPVRRAYGRLREWLIAFHYDGWRNAWCAHCRRHPTMADDCGFWFIDPDGSGDTRPTCSHCYFGAPGAAHIARYGQGER